MNDEKRSWAVPRGAEQGAAQGSCKQRLRTTVGVMATNFTCCGMRIGELQARGLDAAVVVCVGCKLSKVEVGWAQASSHGPLSIPPKANAGDRRLLHRAAAEVKAPEIRRRRKRSTQLHQPCQDINQCLNQLAVSCLDLHSSSREKGEKRMESIWGHLGYLPR